jgi:hypothetical protein
MSVDVRRALKKMQPVMLESQQANLNEADTAQRLVIFFEEVLGYDPLTEISREAQVKDKYVDIALKIGGAVKMLVEAKAAGMDLRDRHIEQAKSYAAEANIRWVVLTNGVIWSLYHLTFEEGIEYERLFLADLATDNLDEAAEKLALIHRRSVARDRHEEFWRRHTALDASSLGKAIYYGERAAPTATRYPQARGHLGGRRGPGRGDPHHALTRSARKNWPRAHPPAAIRSPSEAAERSEGGGGKSDHSGPRASQCSTRPRPARKGLTLGL